MNSKLKKIQELHDKIYELTKEVNQEKDEIQRSGLDPEDVQLAELLHENLCKSDHIEGCDWYYYKWTDPGYDKHRYLEKARKLREIGFNYEDIEKFLQCIK